jgi:hypothetical protein
MSEFSVQDVGVVGALGLLEVVVGKELGEGFVVQEKGEEVGMVFENLALDLTVLATVDED